MNNASQQSGKKPVFLPRTPYRQRRMRDAVRMLPVFGVILWVMPLLAESGGTTSRTGLFIFSVWVLLIVLSCLIVRRMTSDNSPPPDAPNEPD